MSYKNNIKYILKSFWHFVKALAVVIRIKKFFEIDFVIKI